jgi:hypothetical protein
MIDSRETSIIVSYGNGGDSCFVKDTGIADATPTVSTGAADGNFTVFPGYC